MNISKSLRVICGVGKMQKNGVMVIFSGYNQRAVIAFLRVLKRYQIKKYAIIAATDEDPIFKTEYAQDVVYTRDNKDLDKNILLSLMSHVRDRLNTDTLLIIPSTEYLNRLVLEHREELEKINCYIPLCPRKKYENKRFLIYR